MYRRLFRAALFLTTAIVALGPVVSRGAFIGPQWVRPAGDSQAAADRTTFQSWNSFAGVAPGNLPDVAEVNPNGVSDAFDAAALASGSFVTSGGNIYSPAGVIKPRALVPGFGDDDASTHVLVQVEVFGAEIDPADLRVNGVLAGELPGYGYQELSRVIVGGGGPGSGARIEHAWTFTAAGADTLQLDFGWGATSASLDKLLVDTQTVANAPEPGSIVLVGVAGAVLAGRRRRPR
jgi:hypothetical protein